MLTVPSRESNPLLWRLHRFGVLIGRTLACAYFRLFHGVRVLGLHRVPRSGAVLLAPNHVSYYDGFLVGSFVPRPTYAMVQKEYLAIPLGGLLVRLLGAYPLMGAGDRSGYQTLLRLLNEEMCLTVFPEGSRTKDGRLLPLQAGVGRAAVATGARVVPVSLLGLSQCWPRGQTLPRLFRPIVIKFHPPLGGEKIGDKGLAREAAAQLTASLERRLNRSLGAWNRIRNRPNKRH